MIKGICHTNLDEYQRETWPKVFVDVPKEGDYIRAKSGKELKVCKITHCFTFPDNHYVGDVEKSTPYVRIELIRNYK